MTARPHILNRTITREDFIAPSMDAHADEAVLVTVFLRGGADGLTLVAPIGDDLYHKARPTLGVSTRQVLDLDGYFGLHRALEPLHAAWESGRMAIVHGCGSGDNSRSHFEAQDTMEHGGQSGGGWIGRWLRSRTAAEGTAPGALSAVAIGTTWPESLRGAPSGAVMQSIEEFGFGDDDPRLLEALGAMYAREAGALGRAGIDTIEAVKRLRTIREQAAPPEHGAAYPATTFGNGLREIARLIKARIGLQATTIDLNGWDTHFVQGQLIEGLMRELADGLAAFERDLADEAKRVRIVVMTEFGRRLRENTSFGTDHGAGGLMLVIGNDAPDLAGGRIRRGWSDLSTGNLDEVGDVRASIDYRDVLGGVLKSIAPHADPARVFPSRS